LNPDNLVKDGVVPPHLASCVVRPEDFDKGQILLELDPDTDAIWNDAWAQFKAGVKG
jgi:hypothetical protein